MSRPACHARLTLALVGTLWLTGCAALGDSAPPVSDPLLTQLAPSLDRDDWRPDPDWSPSSDARSSRWQLGGPNERQAIETFLAEWAAREAAGQIGAGPDVLARRSERTLRNAVIVLARVDRPEASIADRLASLVLGEPPPEPKTGFNWQPFGPADREKKPAPLSPSTRAAAAEAWCLVLAGQGDAEQRLAAPGRAWRRTDVPDLVRAELLRGLARQLPPERIVGYDELFTGATPIELRRAAIDGCALFAVAHPDRAFDAADWPTTVEQAGLDADPAVRRGYGRWLALARHPEAVPRLLAQLQDADPAVAASAAASLGLLKTDEARDALRKIATRPSEVLRAAAAGALAAWGPGELKPLLADASPVVRRAAVAAAAGCPSSEAAVLLDSVIADRDLDVQRRAVEATVAWPDDLALPVLLSGLQNASVRTRNECLDELRRRSGLCFNEPFPVTGDPAERAAAVADLAAKHHWPADSLTRFRLAAVADVPGTGATSEGVAALLGQLHGHNASDLASSAGSVSPPQVAAEPVGGRDAPGISQDTVLQKLKEAGLSAVSPIEAFCLEHPGPVGDRLMTEVLPALSPAHAAATALGSDDVTIRRNGAGRLAELGHSASLSPLVLRRVRERLAAEQDGLVWRQVMAAVAADATPDAEHVALLALHSPLADVRRLGCEYVARHARPHQAAWLTPLLADPSEAVRLAAAEAIGRCGGTPAAVPSEGATLDLLRAMAAGADHAAQLTALAALARLGDEPGTESLLRRAEFEAPSERLKAVQAIAATGRRRFEPDLTRLARAERDPLVRRELLTALETVVPPEAWPAAAAGASGEDRLGAWAARWEGPAASSTMPPPEAAAGVRPAAPGAAPELPHESGAAR